MTQSFVYLLLRQVEPVIKQAGATFIDRLLRIRLHFPLCFLYLLQSKLQRTVEKSK